MKTIQKLEVIAGVATLTAALLSFWFIVIPQTEQLEKLGYSMKKDLIGSFFFFLLPAFLILIGAYFHATRRSVVSLILIIIFGGMMTFLHAVSFLVGDAFGGHRFLGILPGLFAAVTILLALYWQSVSSAPSEYAPPRR